MKQKHLFALLDRTFTTIRVAFQKDALESERLAGSVKVRFNDDMLDEPKVRGYIYKAPLSDGIQAGDHVVVSTHKGFAVAKVLEVHNLPQIDVDADFDYKWIVQKVDTTAFDARVNRETDFGQMMLEVERTRQREALVDDMRRHLPEGSEALALFERATMLVEGTVGQAAPVTPPNAGSASTLGAHGQAVD